MLKATKPYKEGDVASAAIVTEDRVDFDDLLEGHREFEQIDNAVEFIGGGADRASQGMDRRCGKKPGCTIFSNDRWMG